MGGVAGSVTADLPVLARITPEFWRSLTWGEMEAAAGWVRANGVDPSVVSVGESVEVVVLDAPAIVFTAFLQRDGRSFLVHAPDCRDHSPVVSDVDGPLSVSDCRIATERRHVLLRVPIPVPWPSWLEGP